MRQDLYNMAKNGIVPIVVCVPSNTTDLEYYGERYAATIAGAIKTFTVLLTPYAAAGNTLYDDPDEEGGEPSGFKMKLHRRSRLLFYVKRADNDINRMYCQAG